MLHLCLPLLAYNRVRDEYAPSFWQEAAEKAELAAEAAKGENPTGAVQGQGGGKTVRAEEKEFSIELDKGNTLSAGKYRFQVVNDGKIEHDLAIEGNGVEKKTPLIRPGKRPS